MDISELRQIAAEERRFRVEEMILGMADIVYENRRLRHELEEAKEFEKKYHNLLNQSVDNANKHTAALFKAIVNGAFVTDND